MPNSLGWFNYATDPPPRPDLLLEMHAGGEKFLARPSDLHLSSTRVWSGIWWRLTGIAKAQLEAGEVARLVNGEPVMLPAGASMGAEMIAPEQRNVSRDYAGACWNALMEEESKESLARLYIDLLRETRDLRTAARKAAGEDAARKRALATLETEKRALKADLARSKAETAITLEVLTRIGTPRQVHEATSAIVAVRTRQDEEAGETMPDGFRATAQKGENLG